MILSDALRSNSGAPILVGQDISLSGDALIQALLPPLPASATVGGVALYLREPMKLARALVGLDGRATRLLLLAHDLAPDMAVRMAVKAGISTLLTDTSSGENQNALHVVIWDEIARLTPGGGLAPGQETRWLLTTSGTTGTPKIVEHDLAFLTRSIQPRQRKRDALSWGQLYNTCRFAGLQVLLQVLLTGERLLLPRLDQPLAYQLDMLVNQGCSALSATPTLWRKILMLPQADQLSLTQITLGGEIVDGPILKALSHRFPSARLTHIYASTEAGVGFSVHDGQPGFPASYLEEERNGIRLRLRQGRLWMGRTGEDCEVDSGDAIIVQDGRGYFLGRENGTINVGGNKVYPEEIEAVLLDHPGIAQVRVSARKSSIAGALVMAEIVAAEDCADKTELERSIRELAMTRLESWKCPALIRFVADMAASSGGKLERKTG